jgi:flagellar biosynthesis protein FliQ
MTGAAILDIARDGIITFLKVAAPLMIIALAVGLVVSLLQALTQIQEQTLIFVPKILAVFATMLLMLPFMGDALAGYMTRIAARIAGGIITCPPSGRGEARSQSLSCRMNLVIPELATAFILTFARVGTRSCFCPGSASR